MDELVSRLEETTAHGQVTVDEIMDEIGRRSFGPLLLAAGLVIVTPIIGDIPGVPITVGLVILLLSVQILIGRDHFWLPEFLLNRKLNGGKLKKACRKWLRRPARFVDRFLTRRLQVFAGPRSGRFIAACCVALALMTPPAELVPFSANVIGLAVIAFGAALITHDGLMALLGYVMTAATLGLLAHALM